MKKFAYKCIVFNEGSFPFQEKAVYTNEEDRLNSLGQEGWELVHSDWVPEIQQGSYIFKRELPDEYDDGMRNCFKKEEKETNDMTLEQAYELVVKNQQTNNPLNK